jgi:glycosyltransferase involved in cell wall biosynthesis
MHSASIVIPVYNGAQSIGPLVDELVTTLEAEVELEIVLVNDCSPDNSEEICQQIYHKYPSKVKFFSLAKNVGEHNAVMAGLNQVTGEYTVIMDDDFQNPISEVGKLIAYAYEHQYDVVYSYYEKKEHSWFRNLGSWFNDKVANIMLKKPKDLYLSSFKILKQSLITEIIKYDLPFPYLDGLVLRSTDSIGKLLVKHDARNEGKSGYTLKKLISLWLNMFINFSILPLRLTAILGFVFAFLGFLIGIYSFIERIVNPALPQGYTTIIFVVSVVSGVQMISIGLLGEYLGRMFLSQNKTPQFVIRKRYSSDKSNPKK